MIFVTVGSIRFDGLVEVVDTAVSTGFISEPTIIQIGNGQYIPKYCEYFRTAPGLEPYYERAELVVGHGGTGTTLEIIEKGLRLISVSNPAMIDNHQVEFLEELSRQKLVNYCRSLSDLPAQVRYLLAQPAPQPFKTSNLYSPVIEALEGWLR